MLCSRSTVGTVKTKEVEINMRITNAHAHYVTSSTEDTLQTWVCVSDALRSTLFTKRDRLK